MRHPLICREYPPAPGGGIGTYAFLISHLLAESGETVHVISQAWEGAEKRIQEECNGRLIIHRIPFEDWTALRKPQPHPDLCSNIGKSLFNTEFYAQGFSWEAGLLAERLVEMEGIDLIEAQEYEAPLYYFLLRRALGLGPRRSPPCMVHLHSPTEYIASFNDWDLNSPTILAARRLEEYCIDAADALLCPSSFLARQVQEHYEVDRGRIEVIPLPKAAGGRIKRAAHTWAQGPICYVGRLERRKGLLEWIRAAVQIAQEAPQAVFEFAGVNILGRNPIESELILRGMIPKQLRPRFVFHGGQARQQIPEHLARARIAAVPSRWENFPYACIEAMSSGVPVLATRQGGMPEMIRDGHTGWLAGQPNSESLAQTLRRALETPPDVMAEMGERASAEIEQICSPGSVLEKQIEYRRRIALHPATRSRYVPALPTRSARISSGNRTGNPSRASEVSYILLVLSLSSRKGAFSSSLRAIAHQHEKPYAVWLVPESGQDLDSDQSKAALSGMIAAVGLPDDRVHLCPSKTAALDWASEAGLSRAGIVFMRAGEEPRPAFFSRCRQVLSSSEQAGIISFWAESHHRKPVPSIRLYSSRAYKFLGDGVDPASAIRAEALESVVAFGRGQRRDRDIQDLANRILRDGWVIVTIPEVLMERPGWLSSSPANRWKSRTRQPNLKLIEVFNLAREHPGFFFEMAVWALLQVRKKFQAQG
jgi:glycosyltransferase involved in cell wall biosynthesis